MVEGARLESVYTGNGIAGSNPALSACGRRPRALKLIAVAQDLRSRPLIYRAEIYRRLFERGRPSAVEVRCPLLLVLFGAVAMAKAPKL